MKWDREGKLMGYIVHKVKVVKRGGGELRKKGD